MANDQFDVIGEVLDHLDHMSDIDRLFDAWIENKRFLSSPADSYNILFDSPHIDALKLYPITANSTDYKIFEQHIWNLPDIIEISAESIFNKESKKKFCDKNGISKASELAGIVAKMIREETGRLNE